MTGNVAEYLMSEVLAKQGAPAREFLLRTCVADELVPDLVEALTGRPCDLHLLEVMARGNSFIELVPGHHDRYRYHALFREFLRRLAFESPGLVGELHRVAAEWLVADGQVFAAIRHAARAQEWQMADRAARGSAGLRRAADGLEGRTVASHVHRPAGRRPRHDRALTRAALALSELDLPRSELHLAAARGLLAEDRSPQSQVRVASRSRCCTR